MPTANTSHHHAHHRMRMRERIRENGLDTLQEHEVLEYLLYFALPRVNTNDIAHELLYHFGGSICNVLEATEEDLLAVKGVGPKSAELIHAILPLARYYTMRKRDPHKPLDHFEAALEYLRPLFTGLQEEHFYVIALDEAGCPLRDVLVNRGLPNKVQFDVNALVRQTINTRCTQVLLAHNHPAGLANPSQEDHNSTIEIVGLLGPVGIKVLDHIIVTPQDAYSLKMTGELPYFDKNSRLVMYEKREQPAAPAQNAADTGEGGPTHG